MSLTTLFDRRAQPQTRNPAAGRPSIIDRFAVELRSIAARAPAPLQPAAQRIASSPRATAAGLGVVAVGLGLFLATNKNTRAGVAALVGAAIGLSARADKTRRSHDF